WRRPPTGTRTCSASPRWRRWRSHRAGPCTSTCTPAPVCSSASTPILRTRARTSTSSAPASTTSASASTAAPSWRLGSCGSRSGTSCTRRLPSVTTAPCSCSATPTTSSSSCTHRLGPRNPECACAGHGGRYRPAVATSTQRFGTGKRESHDSSEFYKRFEAVEFSSEETVADAPEVDRIWCHSAEEMGELPDNSVALMVTSPPYHAGKDYDSDASFTEYLGMLERVFAETHRVLEPGGRAVVNVANLGRKPYVPLASLITVMMTERLGYFMRGEIIWRKSKGMNGSCAWGSWQSAKNPTI